ncbi:phosphate signaling complex protein PhoU [Anabaenopsis tanganyikae CS-531]|uniref:Phosphate-specific transport system accessory protein PhoU n=2 Tax=Anabaenopsis TaxID=110103 RepID=A0ABT5ATZ6_9CYAN|nr:MULTISPECIES: phosphate signaling complex protein PhoU [Anabaenopsis]MDB9540779.1 phosphate signaling complex protein PhoU [Anabaenopsis arnoldii]MDH6093217.1 phosphate signaling complex protein PhoU [Anabaenopsis arnoldii]MDH6099296.1 phosphate signaling complex protein PhoU [Anabaenopsis sp. FSS-46]MDH6104931.1 phosphate signaling complex protein PhoU [Anabaenopsis tanganyikae CS-531]
MQAALYDRNSQPQNPQLARAIRRLERDILRMGALVEQSFRLSHQALFSRDLTASRELPRLDKKIDRFYRQIESDCTTIITLQAPTDQNLRCLSAFMQLVRDLERIGDYAEDLANIAVKIFPYPPHSSLPEIEEMSHHAQAMLASSLKALADLDEVGGRDLKRLDDTVDHAYDRVYQTLAQQRDVPGVVEPIVLLALAIRCLERMADHATNIGRRVAYIVTGQSC